MTEFKGQTSITIQAPVEAVYAYLADFTRHPEWAQNLSQVTPLTPGPQAVGATFRTKEGPPPVSPAQKARMMVDFLLGVLGGARTYSEAKITALEPNHRIAWQAGVPKGESYLSYAEWEFCFEPQGAATRLTQHFRYAPPDPRGQRMMAAAGVDGIERACAVSLARLKRRLEYSAQHDR